MIPYFDGRTSARNRLRVVVGKCPPSQGSGVFGTVDGFGAAMREKCAQSQGFGSRRTDNRDHIYRKARKQTKLSISPCVQNIAQSHGYYILLLAILGFSALGFLNTWDWLPSGGKNVIGSCYSPLYACKDRLCLSPRKPQSKHSGPYFRTS